MLRKTLDRQWIGGIERRDPSADILCHLLAAHVEQAVNEAFRRLVERLVAIDRIGERLRIAGSLECSNAEFVGSAKVAPRQLRVFFLQSDQPQVHMGIEEVGAFGKQPDEFVPGDLRFTRLHHRLHLLHVGPPPAGTSGVHKFPYRAGRGLVLFEGEFFSHGSLFPDHSRLCVWNPRKTRLQGARVKKAGKVAGRRRRRQAAGVIGLADSAAVANALLRWYARARRDLPWRRSQDPYRVWVSEIMLQQTQVERVKDFYLRFLERFPTVTALAAGTEHDVLRLWEGLGYYRRARQLHAAAKKIVAEHGGEFPQTVVGLRTLPGIGRYTAGAIASIALDQPEPIVEANSRRVIARLVGHTKPLDGAGGDEPIWEIATGLVPRQHPGRFNQALMDLGAMVCTPEQPLCGTCPLAAHCEARRTDRVAEIPAKGSRRAVKVVHETAVVVRRGARVLVVQRGPGEWWEGLWDFPRLPGGMRSVRRGIERSELLGGLSCGATERLGKIAHSVTHHRITLDVVSCTAGRIGPAMRCRRWVTATALELLAMTSPGRRIARLVLPVSKRTPT